MMAAQPVGGREGQQMQATDAELKKVGCRLSETSSKRRRMVVELKKVSLAMGPQGPRLDITSGQSDVMRRRWTEFSPSPPEWSARAQGRRRSSMRQPVFEAGRAAPTSGSSSWGTVLHMGADGEQLQGGEVVDGETLEWEARWRERLHEWEVAAGRERQRRRTLLVQEVEKGHEHEHDRIRYLKIQ